MNIILDNCFVIGQKYALISKPSSLVKDFELLKDMVNQLFEYAGRISNTAYSNFIDSSGKTHGLNSNLFLNSDRFYYEFSSAKRLKNGPTALMACVDCKCYKYDNENVTIDIKAGTIFTSFERHGKNSYLIKSNNNTIYRISKKLCSPVYDIEKASVEPIYASTVVSEAEQVHVNFPETVKTSPAAIKTLAKNEEVEILTVTKYIVNGLEFESKEQAIGAKKVFESLK